MEGDKSTFRNQSGPSAFQAGPPSGNNPPSKERWKPQPFSRNPGSSTTGSSSVAQREVHYTAIILLVTHDNIPKLG